MTLVFTGDFKPDHANPDLGFLAGRRLITNLECAVSNTTSRIAEKAYPIIYRPEDLQRLQQYPFVVVSIANNHVGDAGKAGLDSMRAQLSDLNELEVAGTRDNPVVTIEVEGLRCAIIASLESCRARPASIVREDEVEDLIRKVRPTVDRVFVTPHWGKEGELSLYHSPRQRELARRWVNAGADAILGHHSHTVHGMEWISGKPVFYSLGNFLFDHEEGFKYPLTRVGLVVEWNPMGGDDQAHSSRGKDVSPEWVLHPITTNGGSVVPLEGELKQRWLDLFGQLGQWPANLRGPAAWIHWARSAGSTYITKSDESWAKRLHGGSGKTRLLWLIWSCLPVTLALRLGAKFPDEKAEAISEAFRNNVMHKLPS